MKVLCECNSFNCTKSIDIPVEEQLSIENRSVSAIIVDGCPNGPDLTDTLVEKKLGYSIYIENSSSKE